jgi:hypothetical protein
MAGIKDLLSLCCWIDNTNSGLLQEAMAKLAACSSNEGEQDGGGSLSDE